jgi:adenylylsulfate kinase
MNILIMGLPGAGKTTLAAALQKRLNASWHNADEIRTRFNDWDFSQDGRLRQASRMSQLAAMDIFDGWQHSICDFVAPTEEIRKLFNADYVIWVDTIKEGRFEDTNRLFEPPTQYDMRVIEQDAERWATIIAHAISIKELNER